MKITAVILQSVIFVLNLVAVISLPAGAYNYRFAPFLVMAAAVVTVVALVRPFGRRGQIAVIVVNALFVALIAVGLVGLVVYQIAHGGQSAFAGVLLILFAIPYVLSIVAVRKSIAAPSKHAG